MRTELLLFDQILKIGKKKLLRCAARRSYFILYYMRNSNLRLELTSALNFSSSCVIGLIVVESARFVLRLSPYDGRRTISRRNNTG